MGSKASWAIRIEELSKSIPGLNVGGGGEERDPMRRSLSAERAKAEAALAAIQAGAGGEHQTPLLGVLAAQQAQQLGAISSLQQAQLAQVAALAGDDRTLSMVQAQQQQQLAQLATAMQAQLNQLAEAIGTLNRSTDNLHNLPDNNKSKSNSTRESLENNTDWASALALTTTNGGDDDAAAGRGADVDNAAALVWPTTDEVPPRAQ